MAVAGVEWGFIQALAVGAPGPCLSVCVIAKALQLAEVREGVYQQMDGEVMLSSGRSKKLWRTCPGQQNSIAG